MKKLVSTRNLSREEWLKYHKNGIGGSDAAAVCGLNPYSSPIKVYYDKITDEISRDDNEAMRQGRDLEGYVAKRFMEETGLKVRRANGIFYDEAYPVMFADADRLVVGENAGLECKTVSPYSSGQWEDGKIPIHYQIQCHHYMSVFQAEAWYIAALIFGKGFIVRKIRRDGQVIRDLRRIETDFWENHVRKKVLPEPDGSEISDQLILQSFGRAEKGRVLPLSGFSEKLERREELSGLISKMETEKKQIEQELKLFLGEAEAAEGDGYRIAWKNVDTSRIDSERLKRERPEIYAGFQKIIHSRRLTVKAA